MNNLYYEDDLNSFSPIHHPSPDETEPRGILINKTNTAANQYQPPPKVTTNHYQPPPPKPDPPTQPQPPIAAANIHKPIRPRSASIQSRKSIGETNNDDEKLNPGLREHPRKTIVAFGRTTKVDETIKNIRPTGVPYKPPIGSTKDIMDLRKTVEHQTVQIQTQQEEIQKLKTSIQVQQEKYCYLLDSNSKLWSYLNNIEKQIAATKTAPEKKQYNNHMMAKDMGKENVIVSNIGNQNLPKDSIAIKKYREKNVAAEEKVEKPVQKSRNEEEHQLVPTQNPIKIAPEIDAISAVQRYLNANPNRAKEIEKIAKNLNKKQPKSHSDESEEEESERKKMEKRKGGGGHGGGHHQQHHHKHNNDVVEKITLERKIYKRNNIRDYLSSTVDDTLEKFGIFQSTVQDRNHRHHQNRRRQSPTTPTIHEVTSSSSSSSFADDTFLEEQNIRHRLSPERHRQQHHRGKKDSDGELRKTSSVEATMMPDRFDDDDMSSDSDTPPLPPQPRKERRQRVAERFKERKH
uniref:Uncharacterized protein n=1 Tax=Panagrolaimus sp. ES5 TaxID=591445 RepID=A0AC34GS70_9BILA